MPSDLDTLSALRSAAASARDEVAASKRSADEAKAAASTALAALRDLLPASCSQITRPADLVAAAESEINRIGAELHEIRNEVAVAIEKAQRHAGEVPA